MMKFKKALTLVMSGCLLLTSVVATACGEEQTADPEVEYVEHEAVILPTEDTLALPHYNGLVSTSVDGSVKGDGTYDSDLLYKPERDIWGADEGVIYVSEEEDPVNGGWFYLYVSGTGSGLNDKGQDTDVNPDGSNMMVMTYRSRDLNDWRICGALEGYSLYLDSDTWVDRALWAAEVIRNPGDGKYYMYFSAQTRDNDGTIPGATYENYDEYKENGVDNWARFSAGVACADAPQGPFYMVSSERNYDGGANPNGEIISHVNPTIDFQQGYGASQKIPLIDFHPIFIDDGNPNTFDLYLYYVHHLCVAMGNTMNTIWGVKMKDMATPDYSTGRWLLGSEKVKSVTYNSGANWDRNNYSTTSFTNEADSSGGITEAPTLLMRKTGNKMKYYLCYSPYGVGGRNYDVRLAVSDSPLGPFEKLTHDKAALSVDDRNDFMMSLGHCSVVRAGDQDYMVFGCNPVFSEEYFGGRYYAFANYTWYYDKDLGYDLPIVNGPNDHLLNRPNVATGYTNVASRATVSGINVNTDSLKYLTDGIVTHYKRLSDLETYTLKTQSGFIEYGSNIVFTFNEPVTLRGISIFNSYDYYSAFKKIDYITFELAEEMTIGAHKSKSVAIKDLPFDASYVNADLEQMRPGGASIATFYEMKVKKVTITISSPIYAEAANLRLSEIVLLGK